MKRSNRKQRRRNQDYQDKRRSGAARENRPEEQMALARSEPAPTQGLRLPSDQPALYLMEARNGMLVDVPENKLDDWLKMQGREEEPQLTEADESLLEAVLEMIYGKEEKKK